MSDLIKRLRRNDGEPYVDLRNDAADEIERLTAELKLYRTGEAYTLAAAEIGRLRAALESIAANTCCDKCQEAALVASEALKDE